MTAVPGQFFSELLPQIDDLGEMKVTLFTLWFLDRLEGSLRYVAYADFAGDGLLTRGLPAGLDDALERAVLRGTLLRIVPVGGEKQDAIYFLNTPRGRAVLAALERGEWRFPTEPHPSVALEAERPNIFRLYEQNIGPLTPLIAEALQEAEQAYPAAWLEDAFRQAVERNARNWKYIERILRSWQEDGRDQPHRR